MARPRTASNVLKLKGAYKKNPQRENKNEPEVKSPFPSSPPAHLSAKEKKIWNEVVAIAPAGVLTGADIFTVEMISKLIAEYRLKGDKFTAPKLSRLSGELKSIGLNPSGRASLVVEKQKVNKYSKI